MIEWCLKAGLHIIYQDQYTSYPHMLELANINSLKVRRLELITRFSKNKINSEKYKHWFSFSQPHSE